MVDVTSSGHEGGRAGDSAPEIGSPMCRAPVRLITMMSAPPEWIETERLVLRRELSNDAVAIADAIARNRTRLLPWMGWATDEAAQVATQIARISEAGEQWDAGEMFDYGIFDRVDGLFMGKIGLHRRIGPHVMELGYWLDTGAEGRGVITEATARLVREALDMDGISRVEIHCDEANARSRAVPERLGFVLDRIEQRPIAAASETGRHLVWVYQPDRR